MARSAWQQEIFEFQSDEMMPEKLFNNLSGQTKTGNLCPLKWDWPIILRKNGISFFRRASIYTKFVFFLRLIQNLRFKQVKNCFDVVCFSVILVTSELSWSRRFLGKRNDRAKNF